jgi:hypothetical protein
MTDQSVIVKTVPAAPVPIWEKPSMPDVTDEVPIVHCNRDHAMIDGFNPDLKLTRTQTVMEGASHCDFRFTKKT